MEENDDETKMTGIPVRIVTNSKVNPTILLPAKTFNPERYGSSSSLTKTRNDASSFGFPEDMRISKLLKRLCAERNVEGALDLCQKLKGVIVDPTNFHYIKRSFSSILESFNAVLLDGPEECQPHIVEIMAKIGVIMRSDFQQFRAGILKTFKNNKSLKVAMMKILQRTIELSKESKVELTNEIHKVLDALKDFLEKTDNVEIFTSVSSVIDIVAINYPKQFRPFFTDIVDILVGWHLETDQSVCVKHHCGKILENFRPFWRRDIKFTMRLLDQIVEDIVLNSENLKDSTSESEEVIFASFVGAFNTILKCLDITNEEIVSAVGFDFLLESYGKILAAAKPALARNSRDDEVITTINECIALLFSCPGEKFDAIKEDVQSLIEIQLKKSHEYTSDQLVSLIFIILRFLRAMRTKISMEFITLLLSHPSFLQQRHSRNGKIREAMVKLWQEIVDVKNVAILEKVYAVIVDELKVALETLRNPSRSKGISEERAKFLIIFHLNSLARLAASSTSIIALYALKPSLLEMLTSNLSITDEIWRRYPLVYHAVVALLVAHCNNNGNFTTSSGLLKDKMKINKLSQDDDESQSPTSDHFEMILTTVDTLMKQQGAENCIHLLLDWSHHLMLQTSSHGVVLRKNTTFNNILLSIVQIPAKTEETTVILKSAEILNDFLDKFTVIDEKIFPGLAEICCTEMCHTNHTIREKFTQIFSKIPLNVSLRQVNDFTGTAKNWNNHIREMQQWHKSSTVVNEIWPNQFREFLEAISFSENTKFCDNLLREMVKSVWTEKPSCGEYSRTVMKDIRCLVAWIQWEAAQFCVANKLRTPFGKPQETFLKIEAIVKEDARILDLKQNAKVSGIETVVANQRHARILLGFMEALEKAIYCATEGTAFALPGPEAPAMSFFHLNSSTCNEWFNRIRTAVDLVALHCMEPEMVIRYTEATIRNLVEANRVSEPLFEHTVMSLAWALLRNGESDSLSGLYTWTKKITGKRLMWVKLAAEQAAGHREAAASGYAEILEMDHKLDRHIREFIADQLVQCLLWSMQWQKLADFLEQEESRAIPRVTIPLINITSEQMRSLIRYEEDNSFAEECLSQWEMYKEDTEFDNNFSYHHIISLAENTIFCVFPTEKALSPGVQNICSKVLQNSLQEALRTHSQEHLNNLTLINHCLHKVSKHDVTVDSLAVDKVFGSLTLIRILMWAEFFCGSSKKVDDQNAMLRLDMISMSRKEGNLDLCKRELERYYSKSNYFHHDQMTLDSVCATLMNHQDSSLWNVNLGRAVYETSKWLYCFPEKREFTVQFTAATALGIRQHISENQVDPLIIERAARILLTISEWLLPEDEKNLIGDCPLGKLLYQLPDVSENSTSSTVVPAVDLAVGKLVAGSVKLCPDLSKAWNALGGWCYKWGRKMVENRQSSGNSNTLFQPADIEGISRAIPEASQGEISQVIEILTQQQVPTEIDDIEPGDGSSTELLENQMRKITSLADISQDQFQVIIGIWRRAHKYVYGYYEMAADAYFKYLQLGNLGRVDEDGASSTVAATLRLLRLIVKHALGLQEVLEEGLASTPTSPWKVIIPQLFSRLNHHEPYVRRRVSELLCRVAEDSPHIIIFPAVVGAAQDEKTSINGTGSTLSVLLDTLSKQAADTVSQVQLLVRELRRVCLLWDELCLVTMSQIYVESGKKFNELEAKIAEEGNTESSAQKYQQLMKPVLAAMDKLTRIISKEPETKNEAAFQEKFLKPILELRDLLKEPMNRDNPMMPWQRFKSLCSVFQQRVQKRSNYVLKMSDISPVLAAFKNTAISMPGVENSGKQQIYIKSVENMVQILNTKTKPKKLAFCGSDGNRYTYLFKGLEDLHLDERIMQFLSIANSMMSRTIDCNGIVSSYRARHYSVIPLGPQSGLISWVDGVLPIFSVYKKWQQREAAKPRKDKESAQVMRPPELFYSKLTPKLQARGMKISDPRSTWPLDILREVLAELSAETPRDLLSREFWCTSTTAAEWRQIVRNYSRSLAVMSVIGYIIGLGDRHLDNVLVNLSTGEIVHIDYNVCFEKGKTLRVPEKIPFRMTQNLENALGVTGIEGTFRLACENVLKALKRGRETLLTLLEAFVYDPLVDWAVGEDDNTTTNGYADVKQTSKSTEQEQEMLKLRYDDVRKNWRTNRTFTVDLLKQMRDCVESLCEMPEKLKLATEECVNIRGKLESLENLSDSQWTDVISLHKSIRIETKSISWNELEKLFEEGKDLYSERYNEEFVWPEDEHIHYRHMVHYGYIWTSGYNHFPKLIGDHGVLTAMGEEVIDLINQYDLSFPHNLSTKTPRILQLVKSLLREYNVYKKVGQFVMDFEKRDQIYNQCLAMLRERRIAEVHQELLKTIEFGKKFNFFNVSRRFDDNGIDTYCFHSLLKDDVRNMALFAERNSSQFLANSLLEKNINLKRYYLGLESMTTTCNLYSLYRLLNEVQKDMKFFRYFADQYRKDLIELTVMSRIVNMDWNFGTHFDCGLCNLKNIVVILHLYLENFQYIAEHLYLDLFGKVIEDDNSVLSMITTVSALQDDAYPLQKIIAEVATENTESLKVAESIHKKFECLMEEYKKTENKTQGQLLLLNLYDRFADIDNNFVKMITSLHAYSIPEELIHFAELVSSKQTFDNLFYPAEKLERLQLILVLMKLEAIVQLFTEILQIACDFKGATLNISEFLDSNNKIFAFYENYMKYCVEDILKPVSTYCTTIMKLGFYERFKYNGRPDNSEYPDYKYLYPKNCKIFDELLSHTLSALEYDDLFQIVESKCDKKSNILLNGYLMEQAEADYNLDLINLIEAKKHPKQVILLIYEFVQFRSLTYCYYTKEQSPLLNIMEEVLERIKEERSQLSKICDKLKDLIENVDNVLKNVTNLNDAEAKSILAFRSDFSRRKDIYENALKIADFAVKPAEKIFFHEQILRNAWVYDKSLSNKIRERCRYLLDMDKILNNFTADQREVFNSLPKNAIISDEWRTVYTESVKVHFEEAQTRLQILKDQSTCHWRELTKYREPLEHLHEDFIKISTEIRNWLKSSLKVEGNHQNATKDYLTKCKNFTAIYDSLMTDLKKDNVTVEKIVEKIDCLLTDINGIFVGPSELKRYYHNDTFMEKNEENKGGKAKDAHQNLQKRNAYAVSVWRRIRLKLEGREPEPTKRITVPEQVDWMIREAMDRDNLAILYEGWTPWV